MTDMVVYVLLYISLFFEVFVLLVFLERRGEILPTKKKVSLNKNDLPKATVMIPVFNEERTVVKTVNSLLNLSYPKNKLEILIIDDGSTDNTQGVLAQFKNHSQIKILSKENGGKFTALNYGLGFATGDIIGCLDADSYVEHDALLHVAEGFKDKETMAVIPAIKIGNPETILQHTQAVEYTLSILIRKVFSWIGSVFVTPGPFSFFRKEVYSIVGPYRHAHNTEDLEICLRMQEKHLRITNAHDAVVFTISPRNIKALYKQRVRWIYGFLRNMKDYYRSFFFQKQHGNLGFFILPISTISIYSAIYFGISLVINTTISISKRIGEYAATGLYFDFPSFDFNWFYINTSVPVIVGVAMISLVFCMLLAGLSIAKEKFRISRGLVFYATVYGFIATYWLMSASIKAFLAKKPSWR